MGAKKSSEPTSNPNTKKGAIKTAEGVTESPGLAAKVRHLRKKYKEDATVEMSEAKAASGAKMVRRKTQNSSRKSKQQRTRTEECTAETESSVKNRTTSTVKVRNVPSTPAQMENYIAFLKETCHVGVAGILKAFADSLKTYLPPGFTTKAFSANSDKNRYKDVLCLDATRVVLRGKTGETDYIHANIVEIENLSNRFICTQGPMANTTYDFWRMIVQEKCMNIFMLCQTVELGKEKCQQYWPKEKGGTLAFKDITIRNLEVDKVTDNTSIVSSLAVSVAGKEVLKVKHYHWQSWPDRSVPHSILAPFRLLKVARNSKFPTVVHCSAGVGRTGAVVGIEVALQHILSGKATNITQVVQELRAKRMHCVQTDLQLVYIYRCLIAYADVCGVFKGQSELEQRCQAFIRGYDCLVNERVNGAAQGKAGSAPGPAAAVPQPAAGSPLPPPGSPPPVPAVQPTSPMPLNSPVPASPVTSPVAPTQVAGAVQPAPPKNLSAEQPKSVYF